MTEPLALNLNRRRAGFEALTEFLGDMRANNALLPWEVDALIALVESLRSQDPRTAQDRQRHGFVR
jgi:hypothetical protein